MAPFLYGTKDGPRYIKGHGVNLAMVAYAALIYLFMSFWFRRVNKARAEGKEDWKTEGKTEEEVAELGDASPRFVFTY